ncbi:MAG TPA: rhodanese-like domain-containing protein [Phycisphaerae bacterium]|nr:rhodanese-like domain-containing protein [Phycisphaerae bacterium]
MKFKAMRIAPLCLLLSSFSVGCAKNDDAGVKEIHTAREMQDKMNVSNITVIHALSRENYEQGHIPGAKNIDVQEMTPQDLPENKDLPLVFYCGSATCPVGHRAASKASSWGHTHVWVYKGGMADWRSSGMQVATGPN